MEEDYYKILNVNKKDTQASIKKAYYKLAKQYHPDKVPEDQKEKSTQRFQEIREAYEVLSDEEKRRIYDQFGKEGLKSSNNGFSPFNPFSDIFGNFGFNNRPNQKRQILKNKDTIFNINLSLSKAFTGCVKKVKITRKVIWNTTTNDKVEIQDLEKSWEICSECNGNGMIMEMRQIGPGMIQQISKSCLKCVGKGVNLLEYYIIKEIEKILEISIPKGVENKWSKRIQNMGNCSPGKYPGDIIIFVSVESKEDNFYRESGKLYYKKAILLSEALCGGAFKIKHLDSRILFLSLEGIIKPGDIKTIENEVIKDNKLYIIFDIKFPEKITKRKELLKLLPSNNTKIIKDKDDIHYKI